MTAQYMAAGGVIFTREHMPVTLERAHIIRSVHLLNASYQLDQSDERSLTARLGLAKIEQSLADEMAEAIRAVSNPLEAAA